MSQEKFWILFSKKLSGEANQLEISELEKLINEHPEWQYAIQNLEDLWEIKNERSVTHEDEDAFLVHLQTHKDTFESSEASDESYEKTGLPVIRRSKRVFYRWAGIAAVFAGVLLVSIFFFRKNSSARIASRSEDMNEISTRLGSKTKIQLPDGSVVWLNAGSKLTYDKEFGKELREVALTGEGFFDVTKDKERPFIIHTKAIDIKVLGTAFNVRAYPEDKTTETSLIRGSIEVSVRNRPNDKIILSPNEKLVVMNREAQAVKIQDKRNEIKPEISVQQLKYNLLDSTVAETQWVENKLVFRDEDFAELVKRLERWYDVPIEIRDKELENIHFSGTFSNETIDQALQALKITTEFQYKINNDTIIIHK